MFNDVVLRTVTSCLLALLLRSSVRCRVEHGTQQRTRRVSQCCYTVFTCRRRRSRSTRSASVADRLTSPAKRTPVHRDTPRVSLLRTFCKIIALSSSFSHPLMYAQGPNHRKLFNSKSMRIRSRVASSHT